VSTHDPGPARHELAEQLVRHVAAGTGLTTIVTIGVSADGVPIVTREGFSQRHLDASYEQLLVITAQLVRQHPRGIPTSACALILPERDVAYLYHDDTGSGLAQVLTVGRNPVDLPTTRVEVSRGLHLLMQTLADTRQRPAAASAFLADPTACLGLIPPPPQQPGAPAPDRPEHRGPHR
jgi:hypothetical protein